ncbi:MAG: DUF4019 domain-containing protein [Steroidobacteraceae bacterium]
MLDRLVRFRVEIHGCSASIFGRLKYLNRPLVAVPKIIVLALVAISTSSSGYAQEANGVPYRILSSAETDSVQGPAQELAREIDTAAWSVSQLAALYRDGGQALQVRYSLETFADRIHEVRNPLGAVKDRKFSGFFGPYHSLPNLINGDYLIVVFKTHFEGGEGLYSEQITLEADRYSAGTWRLVEYYVEQR